MVYEYVLALAFLLNIGLAPQPLAPYKNKEDCMAEAAKMNKTEEAIRTPKNKAMGAEFVCLKVERVTY
jgi:hypothetical protein